MVSLLEGGAYLLHGTEIIPDSPEAEAQIKAKTGKEISKEQAKKETIAYGILENHNTSGNMDKLKIKFDKLTSHDITFVGIIQTARASGLEKFPIPYVLTNCHNSLCAVGGTINEDDHMFGLTCAKKYGGVYGTASSGCNSPVRERNACRRRQNDPWIRFPYPLRSTWNHGNGRGWTGACKAAFESDL